MAFHHWFIPHRETHKKAHLISWHGMLAYILIFILLQVSFTIFGNYKPGVLGVNSNIDQKALIELTNQERAKAGLEPLTENSSLDTAAAAKASNMFQEDYWAHFAPSGKSPWDFISASGYKFSYAGENLAKNFYESDEVVSAWMASSSHKENIINPHYKEIGMAVVEGVLNGQKTTLVVQMFGTSKSSLAEVPTVHAGDKKVELTQESVQSSSDQPIQLAAVKSEKISQALIDPYQIFKVFGIAVMVIISGLLVVDFVILRKRGVFRSSSHHFANLSFLAVGAVSIINSTPGGVL